MSCFDFSFPNPKQLFCSLDHTLNPSPMLFFCTNVTQLLFPLPFFQSDHSSVISAVLHPGLAGFMHSETVTCHWAVSASKLLLQRESEVCPRAVEQTSVCVSTHKVQSSNLQLTPWVSFLHLVELFCYLKKKKKNKRKMKKEKERSTVLVRDAYIYTNSFLFSPSVNRWLTFQI